MLFFQQGIFPGAIFGSIIYVQIFISSVAKLPICRFSEIDLQLIIILGNAIIIAAHPRTVTLVMREMKLKKNIVTSTARHPTITYSKKD